VRFDTGGLGWFWQFLDPQLLRQRLLESVFYQHSQPPLYNLFIGLMLKLFPGRLHLALFLLALCGGWLLYLSLFYLQRKFGVSRLLAFITSTLFMASPSFILYEQWLFYTFPLALLLTLSVFFLHQLLTRESVRNGWGLFTCLLLLCGIQGTYHIAYFALIFAGLLVACSTHRKTILMTGALPFLLVFSLYAKNLILFGKFSASSWLGMNLAKVTIVDIPFHERQQMVAKGILSHSALISPFSPVERYGTELSQVSGFDNVPALRQPLKSTGQINYNHLAYIGIADSYLRNSRAAIRHRPLYFRLGIQRAWTIYFHSSSDYHVFGPNHRRVEEVRRFYDRFLYGLHSGTHTCYILLAGLPMLFFYGCWKVLRPGTGKEALTSAQRVTLAYICFNILYVALVGNTFDVGENNRFRFSTDPLSVILLGFCGQRLCAKVIVRLPQKVKNGSAGSQCE
jgi:hypothetical protein